MADEYSEIMAGGGDPMDNMDHHNGADKKDEGDEDDRKLFVGGLAHGTNEEILKQYFSSYAEVTKVELKYDPETKKCRGFGFVTLGTRDGLNEVLRIGSHTINGKTIDPKKAMAKPKPPPKKKVFVGGLAPEIPEEDIRRHFEPFGRIEKIELPIDKDANKRRAFCFVVFESEESARNASRNGKQKISSMTKECDVKIAQPPPPKEGGFPFSVPGGGRGGGRFAGPAARGTRGGGARFAGTTGTPDRGGFQGQSWGTQYGGAAGAPSYGAQGGYPAGGYGSQGYQGYGGGYDYSGYNSGGYGNGYDNSYWNYGTGGGYGQTQTSGYGKVKRGAGAQGYHPYQ